MKNYYTTIDHTADLGIQVSGSDTKVLFIHAGMALFDLLSGSGNLKKEKTFYISVNGTDWADLMVNWLRELLYLWSGKEMLVQSIGIEIIKPFFVSANVHCEHFDPLVHDIRHDIKAVTYHRIAVNKRSKGWEAAIIFDV